MRWRGEVRSGEGVGKYLDGRGGGNSGVRKKIECGSRDDACKFFYIFWVK